jgi:hypothetical protein
MFDEARAKGGKWLSVTEQVEALTTGPIHWFEHWPTGEVPRTGAVVYTIWNREGRFIYVGMSGRGYQGVTKAGSSGPWGRLSSHASGRRSGDQFCVYVSDRLVLPQLHNRLTDIAGGVLSLDIATRDFVRANLGFRWLELPDGASALQLERRLQRGEHACGRPPSEPTRVLDTPRGENKVTGRPREKSGCLNPGP